MLILAPLWALFGWEVFSEIGTERDRLHAEIQGAAAGGAGALNADLRLAAWMLRRLRDQWKDDPTAFSGPEGALREGMAEAGAGVVVVQVADASSRLLYASRGAVFGSAYALADPAAFAVNDEEPRDALRISPLVQAEAGAWYLPLSLPLLGPAGEFGGLLSILVDPAFLTGLNGPLGHKMVSGVYLLRGDGRPLLHSAPYLMAQGEPLAARPAAAGHLAALVGSHYQNLADAGVVFLKPRGRELRQGYAWQKLPDFDLALVVASPGQALPAQALRRHARDLLLGLAASLLLVLVVHWRLRVHRAQADLLAEQARQIAALAASQQDLMASQRALRRLNAGLLTVRETERKRIAQEVHDELGQRISVLRMDLALLERNTRDDFAHTLPPYVARLTDDVDTTLAIVRDIASRLRPAALDVSLAAAVEGLAAQWSKGGAVRCPVLDHLPPDLVLDETTLIVAFRILQEAMTNAVQHGNARLVVVRLGLREAEGLLDLSVSDDGNGFDVGGATQGPGMGLAGMRERIEGLGGRLSLHSRRGAGATVHALLPLRHAPTPAAPPALSCDSPVAPPRAPSATTPAEQGPPLVTEPT